GIARRSASSEAPRDRRTSPTTPGCRARATSRRSVVCLSWSRSAARAQASNHSSVIRPTVGGAAYLPLISEGRGGFARTIGTGTFGRLTVTVGGATLPPSTPSPGVPRDPTLLALVARHPRDARRRPRRLRFHAAGRSRSH